MYDFEQNLELNKIIKQFKSRKNEIPSFSDFTESAKELRKQKELNKIIEDTTNALRTLYNSKKRDVEKTSKELTELTFPRILKNDSLYGHLPFASIEINNALLTYQIKPENIRDIIKSAIELKRSEFVETIFDLYLNDSTIPATKKTEWKNFYKEYSDNIGTSDLRDKKIKLDSEFDVIGKQLTLIETNPSQWIAESERVVRVAQQMYDNGQASKSLLVS